MSRGNPKVANKIPRNKEKDKIPVTFNKKQLELIERYMGIMGNTKAEIIRNIVINWLLERGKEGKNDK